TSAFPVAGVAGPPIYKAVTAEDLLPGDIVDLSSLAQHQGNSAGTASSLKGAKNTTNEREACGSAFSMPNIIPADCVLVRGGALVNEAALTGESLPLQKVSYLSLEERGEYPEPKSERHVLHAGTTLLAAETGSLAVVTGIGVGTIRGDAVRHLFSKAATNDPSKRYDFDTHLKVWHTFTAVFVAPPVTMCMLFLTNPSLAEIHVILVQALTTLMMLASPYMPIALSTACLESGKRLETELQLFVMDKHRIPVTGNIDIFAFDKTGTVTEEKMRFYGVATWT
ncbi:unnamed protein product, partial [Amoebophrya sp. A120]